MNRAAFFDIDGTLVNCVTQEVLAKILRREGLLNFGRTLRVSTWFLLYKLGLTNNSENVRKSAYSVFKLHSKERMDAIFLEAQRIVLSRIRWSMKNIVDEHKREGDLIVAISGSLENLCVSVCDVFGIKEQYSAVLSISDGRYNGLWENEIYEGARKVGLIMQLKEKYQLNLNECSSYADSYSDIPMLEVVGHPVAVCPDRKLRKHAASKKWSILEI
jgi:HAD superfamily hydrolase (TIGR01490 family)